MGFEKKFGLGILGAAALSLSGCGDKVEDPTGADRPEAAAVMKENGNTIEITLPEETASGAIEQKPQYTEEQKKQILSGVTGEDDDLTTKEINELKLPQ